MNTQDMSSVSKAINSAFVDLKGISTSDGYKKAHENMKKAVSQKTLLTKIFVHDCAEKLEQRREYSMKLTFPPSGKPYLRDEILDSLAEVGVMPDDLNAVGPISDNSKWMVCLSNKEAVVRLLPTTPSVRSNKARVFSMDKVLNTVKVHWLPTYIPMANVIVFLSQFGVVQTSTWDMSKIQGYEHVRS